MSLIGEERKNKILQLLNIEGKVKTVDLVELFKVSSETVRRYLEELENENKLKRVYGGAMKINLAREEASYFKREVTRAEEKQRIGRSAAELVEDNDIIFIDDGTTTLQMIDFLMNKKNLTVLTISIAGLSMLIDYKTRGLYTGEIYFIGGKVDAVQSRVSGSLTERFMESFFVDKVFVSIDGITPQSGITGFHAERGQSVRSMMAQGKQSIVLTDHSKFGEVQFFKMADLREVDIIISDVDVPVEWAGEMAQKDVVWINAT